MNRLDCSAKGARAQIRLMWRKIGLCATALVAGAFAASSAWALSSCPVLPATISQCCVADQPGGQYELGGDITLATAHSCMQISARNVVFNLNGHTIAGPTPVKGVGLHVLSTAANAVLGVGTVAQFATGFKTDAPNTLVLNLESALNKRGMIFNGPGAFGIEPFALQNVKNGILLTPAASGSNFLAPISEVNNQNGIVLRGVTGVTLSLPVAEGNQKNGILLNSATGVTLEYAVAVANTRYGLWLRSSSFNSVLGGVLEENAIAGAYLGCHADGPNPAACSIPPSNGNTLSESIIASTPVIVGSDCHSPPIPQEYGIVIDKGNRRNHVAFVITDTNTSCSSPGDTIFDGYDGNLGANCGGNFWFDNTLTNENHSPPTSLTCMD